MFKSIKRPVPSADALRVLAQLAYISSGTCLGLATLCAEERRRRTKIIQRIADNAKALRAHPRHRSNVAIAAKRDDEGETADFGRGFGYGSERASEPKEGETVRDAALPSVVREGYERVSGQERRARLWRLRASTDGVAVADEHDESDRPQDPDAMIDSLSSQNDLQTLTQHTSQKVLAKPKFYTASSGWTRSKILLDRTAKNETSPAQSEDNIFRRYTRSHSGVLVELHDAQSEATAQESPAKSIPLMSEEAMDVATLEETLQDLNGFLADHRYVPRLDRSHVWQGKHASSHLRHALRRQSFEDVRSIFMWKLANKGLTTEDVLHIVRPENLLRHRLDESEVVHFYSNVFASSAYRGFTTETMFTTGLFFLAALSSHFQEYNHAQMLRFVPSSFRKQTNDHNSTTCIESVLRTLLHQRQAESAARLYCLLRSSDKKSIAGWLRSEDSLSWREMMTTGHILPSLIEACLAEGHLPLAGQLLTLGPLAPKDSPHSVVERDQRITTFVRLCDNSKRSELLADVISSGQKWNSLHPAVAALDDQTKVIIATACRRKRISGQLSSSIKRTLSLAHQKPNEQSIENAKLKNYLRQSGSWEGLEGMVKRSRRRLIRKMDFEAARSLDDTVLELYLSAGKMEQAIELLRHLSSTQTVNGRLIGLTTLTLATKGFWPNFTQLQTYFSQGRKFEWDFSMVGIWNKIISLYARYHQPQEIWTFVRDLVDRLGFVPSNATARIVLQACVEKRDFDTIPDCLRYFHALDLDFRLDGKLAADMFTWFWLQTRVNHQRIMWHCYYISNAVPSFDIRHFQELAKEAIGYDIRKPYEQGFSSSNPTGNAVIRLDAVSRAQYLFPTPSSISALGSGSSHLRSAEIAGLNQVERQNGDSLTALQQHAPKEHVDTRQILPDDFLLEEMQLDHLRDSQDTVQPLQESRAAVQPLQASRATVTSSGVPKDTYHGMNRKEARSVEHEMLMAMSVGQLQQALDIYHKSLNRDGLPLSLRALDMAVEISIRLHGDYSEEPERLVHQAKEAGMNVAVTAASLIMRYIRRKDTIAQRDANKLRIMVLDYYKLNSENGWNISHHVATTAADQLIKHRSELHAINLLTEINKSKWATHKPLDMVTMTVFLKGYRRLRSLDGIRWVVHHVLVHNLQISRRFVRELKAAFWHPWQSVRRLMRSKWTIGQLEDLESMVQSCFKRRLKQIDETYHLGHKLEGIIKRCAHEQGLQVRATHEFDTPSTRHIDARAEEDNLEWWQEVDEHILDVELNDRADDVKSDERSATMASGPFADSASPPDSVDISQENIAPHDPDPDFAASSRQPNASEGKPSTVEVYRPAADSPSSSNRVDLGQENDAARDQNPGSTASSKRFSVDQHEQCAFKAYKPFVDTAHATGPPSYMEFTSNHGTEASQGSVP